MERAATVSATDSRTAARNLHSALMPTQSRSPVTAMQVVSKRSLAADLAKRPAPAAPSTRGDARIMAMFIGEPSQPHLLAGGGLYSAYGTAPGGRKKMKLVSNNDDDGEDD